MSAYPEIEQIPEVVYVGQIGDCYATAQTEEGVGLLVFLDKECHERAALPVELKGTNPVAITRGEIVALCNVCYLVDPDTNEYVSFLIRDAYDQAKAEVPA